LTIPSDSRRISLVKILKFPMLAGKILQNGKYSLIQEIGRGGFGMTFKAMHHYLGQEVVVKTINDKLSQNPDYAKFERQFQDEARRLATCIHPHIVRVSDFFTEDGLPYMVMEYIPGENLGEAFVLPGIPLSEAIAIHYIRQIGAALQVVHKNGLLHRDIKPDNIILRQGTQNVVLIDFGIAREFNSGVQQTHTGLVSEGYAPIEQYLSQAPRTPATDVYGLAATLYALLTGRVPIPSLLRDREPMPSPRELQPHLSAAVNQAVMRGMAVESRFRPATVGEWLQLLPGAGIDITPHILPTQAVPTIDLSVQPAEKVAANYSPMQPPEGKVVTGEKTAVTSKVLMSIGVALVAATAGFSITKMLPQFQNQPDSKLLFEQPIQPAATPKFTHSLPNRQNVDSLRNTETESPSTSSYRRRKRDRNVETETNPGNNNNISPAEQSPPVTEDKRPTTATPEKPTPVVTASPSLIEKIRDSKSTPPPEKPPATVDQTSTPVKEDNNLPPAPKPENSLPETTAPNSSSPAGVVVPTIETNSVPSVETPSDKEDKQLNLPINQN
jgi:serine/threonine protein kinase